MSSTLRVEGQDIALDQDGYLADLHAWSPAVAEALAAAQAAQADAAALPDHWDGDDERDAPSSPETDQA